MGYKPTKARKGLTQAAQHNIYKAEEKKKKVKMGPINRPP
jgi:hypothetical protein